MEDVLTRTTIAGLSMLAAASLGIAACGPTQAAQPQLTPKQALVASVRAQATTPFDVTLSEPDNTGKGTVDPVHNGAQLSFSSGTAEATIKMDVLVIDEKVYIRMDFGPQLNRTLGLKPSAWMNLDKNKLKDPSELPFDTASMSDPFDLSDYFNAVRSVVRADSTHLTGTIDMTVVTGANKPDSTALANAGDAAKAVPFTAVIDGQGRLVELRIDAGAAAKGLSGDFLFSNYGAGQTVMEPANADVIEMPNVLYQVFNR
jgi:hypothetical protein